MADQRKSDEVQLKLLEQRQGTALQPNEERVFTEYDDLVSEKTAYEHELSAQELGAALERMKQVHAELDDDDALPPTA